MTRIVPAVDHRPASTPVGEPSASHHQHEPSTHREPPASIPAIVAGGAVRSASPPHRRRAAALIRQLGGRTEAELRRELDRFFADRPQLSDADRAPIARAMSRFRNQLLHHPRSRLRAAASDDHPAGAHPLLDAVRRLFGLAEAPHAHHAEPRIRADRPTKSSTSSAAS
jgi:glutamyl-tRNA reductase